MESTTTKYVTYSNRLSEIMYILYSLVYNLVRTKKPTMSFVLMIFGLGDTLPSLDKEYFWASRT
jgi:hypothetical protein